MLEISQNKYANNLMNSTPIRVDMPGEERISKNQSKELGNEDAATLEISEEGYRLSEATNYAKVKKSSKTGTYTKINHQEQAFRFRLGLIKNLLMRRLLLQMHGR